MSTESTKGSKTSLLIVAIAALIFIVSSVMQQVPETHYAIITRFGAMNRIAEPGLRLKWPYPVESITLLEKRLQIYERPLTQMALKDTRTLIVSSYCSWQIDKPKEFLKSISSVANAEQNFLPNILGSATAEVLGRYGLSDLVNTDKAKLKYEQIEGEITKAAQLKAAIYGIDIKEARLRLFSFPPDKTTKSLLKRMKQQRIVKAGKLRVEGETQSAKILTEARTKSRDVVDSARVESEKIRGEGESLAAEKFAQMAKSPQLSAFLLKLEALRAVLKDSNTTLILDVNTPPFDLLGRGVFEGMARETASDKKKGAE